MQTVATTHLRHVAEQDERKVKADYLRIVKMETPDKQDLARLVQATQLLNIPLYQVEADRSVWEQFQTAQVKAATEDEHRQALAELTPQLRHVQANAHRIRNKEEREASVRVIARQVTRHSGLLRQAQDATERLIMLRSEHDFLNW